MFYFSETLKKCRIMRDVSIDIFLTPAQKWGLSRKIISRRRNWSHKSWGLEKWKLPTPSLTVMVLTKTLVLPKKLKPLFFPNLTPCLKRLSVPWWIGFKPQGSSQISAFIPKQRIRCWKEVCSAPEYQIFELSNYLWIEQLCKSTVVQFFHNSKLVGFNPALQPLKGFLTSQKNI